MDNSHMTLREARKRRRLTQDELAVKSGISQSAISTIERGYIQSPEWKTVAALCRALRVKPEDVFPSRSAVAS